MQDLVFVFAGFFVGFVVALTGVGGGSLMTPLLIFGFGIAPNLAVGTDLLFAAGTKLGGTLQLARRRLVPWRVVGQLSLGSLPAALLTLAMLHHLGPAEPAVQRAITLTLGLALLLTAAATLYKAARGQSPRRLAAPTDADPTRARHWSLPVALGVVIGTLVTLTSVGAGAVGVAVLLLLYPALPLPRIVAADIAYAVPLTLVAGLGHAAIGSIDWPLLGLLLCGSLPGIWIGARLAQHAPQRLVRTALPAAGLCGQQISHGLKFSHVSIHRFRPGVRAPARRAVRDQIERWQRGELSDEQLLPLRLQNGWYIQRYAPMARIAVPYGEISSVQLRMLARIAREYDRPDPALLAHAQATQDALQAAQPGLALAPPLRYGYGHFTTRTNCQFNWIPWSRRPT
jgi:uncharacterized membrane protein YfcA